MLDNGLHVVIGDLQPGPDYAFAGQKQPTHVDLDLLDSDAGTRLVEAAAAQRGGLDIVVNNVGVLESRSDFVSITDAQWQRSIDINLLSMVRTTRAALPHLLRRGRGSIVSIASKAGRQPAPIAVDYSMTQRRS